MLRDAGAFKWTASNAEGGLAEGIIRGLSAIERRSDVPQQLENQPAFNNGCPS